MTQEPLQNSGQAKEQPRRRYRLNNLYAGSERYGKCEVCDKSVDTTYLQTEEYEYCRPDGSIGWTSFECPSIYGHKECLESKQLNQESE